MIYTISAPFSQIKSTVYFFTLKFDALFCMVRVALPNSSYILNEVYTVWVMLTYVRYCGEPNEFECAVVCVDLYGKRCVETDNRTEQQIHTAENTKQKRFIR